MLKTSCICSFVTLLAFCSVAAKAVEPNQEELTAARHWVKSSFEGNPKKGDSFFFSFNYGGKPCSEFLPCWEFKHSSRKLDDLRTEHTIVYTDPKTKLVIRCVGVEYRDFPNVEWTIYFKNNGKEDSPILSDIQPLDITLDRTPSSGSDPGEFLLHHNAGSSTKPTDYGVRETVLTPGLKKVFAGAGGQPTGSDLCYFNIESQKDQGLIVAVGWPGQVATRMAHDQENHLRIRAGQELTHFKLLPGEEVRTPLIALQFWRGGDWLRAQNVWRKWFIAHNLRKPGGKLPPTQWTGANDLGIMDKSTTDRVKKFIDAYGERKLKPDLWWIDAGWYPCNGSWPNTGTWEPDKARFPKGIREITDYLHDRGIRNVLWFEPERVVAGSWLAENHPEWIFGGKHGGLVDFGNPDALKWSIEKVDELIKSEGVDIYRQDFNMAPLDSWRGKDAADRQGITEIRHVTGLLAFWDELLRRHPNMLYDNCAGGGTRNDLESMRRGVAYCKSDYALEPVGVQGETYGISLWLPYYGASWGTEDNAYICRSNMAHLIGACVDLDKKDHYLDGAIHKRLEEWRKTTAYFWGDFWPLTPYSLDNKVWIAWQFDCPDKGEGVVQAFRRGDNAEDSIQLRLRGLDSEAVYLLTDLDLAEVVKKTGRELLDKGLHIQLKEKPGAAIVLYKKKRVKE
jgi:alpha-galactosidase